MRVKAALAAGLKPIICVGESLEEREAHQAAKRREARKRKRQRQSAPSPLDVHMEKLTIHQGRK